MRRLLCILVALLLAVPAMASRDVRRELPYFYIENGDCSARPTLNGFGDLSNGSLAFVPDPAASGRGTVARLTVTADGVARLRIGVPSNGLNGLTFGTYKLTAWMYIPAGISVSGEGYTYVRYDDGGTQYANLKVSTNDQWEKESAEFTLSSAATVMRIEFVIVGTAGEVAYIDDITLERVNGVVNTAKTVSDLVNSSGPKLTAWTAIADGEYTLDDSNERYIANLADSINAHASNAALQALTVDSISPDRDYRTTIAVAGDIYECDGLSARSLTQIASGSPVTLAHDVGVDFEGTELDDEIDPTALEAACGTDVTVLAYPFHDHDFETTARVRAAGYIAARDGAAGSNQKGNGSYYYGSGSSVSYFQHWEKGLPYSVNLEYYMTADTIMAASGTEAGMDSLIDAGANRRWKWRDNNTWVNVYTHSAEGSNSIDSTHVGAMLDALIADDDCWIAPFGEVAAYYMARHQPTTAEPEVYEPTTGNTSADLDSLPWNGYKYAFTFSTDDGLDDNYDFFEPVFAARGLCYTAFIIESAISSAPYLSAAELLELGESESCEIQMHSNNHEHLIPARACKLTNNTDDPLAVEIYDDSGTLKMKFYTRSGY